MRVGVVVDHALYEDMTMTLGTPTANFEGRLRRNNRATKSIWVFGPNSNNLKIWKWGVTLEQCERSRWLRSHTNFEFCIQTSSQRWTSSRNRLAQVESFNQNKNGLKSSDTLSLGLRKKGAPDFWIFCQGNFAKCSVLCELSMDLHHVSQLSLSGCIYSL